MMSSSWLQVLTAAAPVNSQASHPWICETFPDGQERVFEAISQQEYVTRALKNTSQKIFCEKLSLSRILYKSAYLINLTENKLIRIIEVGDTFSADFNFDDILTLFDQEITTSKILDALNKMCQRSYEKHLALKTHGLWGKIKYYIWYWFYDQRAWVEQLKMEAQANLHHVTLEKVIIEIRVRILSNIESFEYAAAQLEGRTSKIINDDDYKTIKDIKKNWVTNYAEDKYTPPAGEQRWLDALDSSRKRIIVLYQLWDKLERHQPSTQPSDAPLKPPGTPLLEGAS
jgi:hypothetical protein